jgi:hypothetical protein
MRLVIACVFLLAAPLANSQPTTLPTDLDLKTAYCITVAKKSIEGLSREQTVQGTPGHDYMQGMIRDRSNDLHRLQSYLLPKLPSLEASGLIAAAKRAETDFVASGDAAGQCSVRCNSTLENGSMGNKWLACMNACTGESAVYERVNSCRNINWLPF